MAEIPYSSHQSCPNEGFCMPKWYVSTFYLSWRPSFRNPRWPPSAILDMFRHSKITKSASKWSHKLIQTVLEPCDRLPCRKKIVYVQSINHRRPSWKQQNGRNTILQ
jgi:hypothetical protein